ncbi:MAG: hypothetical protein ABI867_16305 [Kofleriaceae bacterium]
MRNLACFAVLLAACTDEASVRLELANQTPEAHVQGLLPDGRSLRLKMIAVYLAEDVDPVTQNNLGSTSMVWLNPQCNGDISSCNIDGFGGGVTEYFDLARSTEAINAELHSQDTAIALGTYRYARVEMCKGTIGELPTVPTLQWQGPGMTSEQAFTSGDCGRTSLAFDPPLELVTGDAVDVQLGYDLSRAIVTGAPSSLCGASSVEGDERCFRACVTTSPTTRTCMDFPDFTPTAAKL